MISKTGKNNMSKQDLNERFIALCQEFLEKSKIVTDIEMVNPRGGKWALVFNGAVCEIGMQTSRLFGAHGSEQLFQERLADKVAGFILSGHNAPHARDALPKVIDQDLIDLARDKGLDRLAQSMSMN